MGTNGFWIVDFIDFKSIMSIIHRMSTDLEWYTIIHNSYRSEMHMNYGFNMIQNPCGLWIVYGIDMDLVF